MSIDSLRDGFVRLCFDPSLNAYSGKCRILLEGQYVETDDGGNVVPDVPMKVTSLRQVDLQFGEGSVLAESLKVAFSCCANGANEIWVIPREDADAAVQSKYTLTLTGAPTADGRFDIYWGDSRYNISVLITAGMSVTQAAAAIVAATPPGFPYTAAAVAGVITYTAINGGTVGNFLNPEVNWHGRLDYYPPGLIYAWAHTVVGSVDPTPLDLITILGECCYCCAAVLSESPVLQAAMIAYLNDAWSCAKPQCFGQGYTYNAGSLGTILARDTNDAVISRLAHCPTDPIFPWLKVAAYAAKSCCSTVDNPEISVQGPVYGVLTCLAAPESCSECFTYDEQMQLKDRGFVYTTPLNGGQGALTSPVIANDITNNRYDAEGRFNSTFRDVSSRRLAAATAVALATQLQTYNGLGLFTRNTDIRPGVKGTNPRLMLGGIRAWAKTQVGVIFSEFDDIDADITLQTDFELAPKCQGVPDKLFLNMVYRPPVRVGQIVSNLQPKLLDNC
jgi:phage tail sheath gpL-like